MTFVRGYVGLCGTSVTRTLWKRINRLLICSGIFPGKRKVFSMESSFCRYCVFYLVEQIYTYIYVSFKDADTRCLLVTGRKAISC